MARENADWVIAWDAAAKRHAYLTGGDVVFSGNAISFVGRGYKGSADETGWCANPPLVW